MVPGTLSMLCAVSLAILVHTGWFVSLEEDLGGIDRRWLVLLLGMAGFFSGREIPLGSELRLDGGVLLFFFLWLRMGMHTNAQGLATLASHLFFCGATLFLFHEWMRMDPVLSTPLAQAGEIVYAIGVAWFSCKPLAGRAVVATGGWILAEWMTLVLHRKEITPLLFGGESFRDTLWATFGALLFLHYGRRSLEVWLEKFRLAIMRIR